MCFPPSLERSLSLISIINVLLCLVPRSRSSATPKWKRSKPRYYPRDRPACDTLLGLPCYRNLRRHAEALAMLNTDGDVLYRQVLVRTASPPRPASNRRPERHEHSDPQNFLHRHRSATTPSERSRWRIRFTRRCVSCPVAPPSN